MLAKGIQLTLLMGPIIPFPAPRVVMDALDNVQVTTAAGSSSGFQLSFQFSAKSELNTIFLIAAGQSTSIGMPPLRVMLVVTFVASEEGRYMTGSVVSIDGGLTI